MGHLDSPKEIRMDKTLALMADYNAAANARLVASLSALEAAKLEADRGSYYKSLKGLFDHVVSGEHFSLNNLARALPGNPSLDFPQLKVVASPGIPAFPVREEALAALKAFDAAYRALAGSLEEAELEATVDVRGSSRKVRFLLTSAFFHAAHHRAQASQILDEDGIENDFYAAIREVAGS